MKNGRRRHTRTLSQDCTAALKSDRTDLGSVQHCGLFTPARTLVSLFFFYTQLAFGTGFKKRGSLPLPGEMTSVTVCAHQNKWCFSWPRPSTFSDELCRRKQRVLTDVCASAQVLKHLRWGQTLSVLCVYLCAFVIPLKPLKYTKPHQCLSSTWEWQRCYF